MNYEIQNISRRPVAVYCNSGKTCYLPPGYIHEIAEQEIAGNSFIKKMESRNLIAIRKSSGTATGKPTAKGGAAAETKSEKGVAAEKAPAKKTQAKKND